MEPWQPFWSIALMFGFLVGLFKSIVDIIDQKFKINDQNQSDDSND